MTLPTEGAECFYTRVAVRNKISDRRSRKFCLVCVLFLWIWKFNEPIPPYVQKLTFSTPSSYAEGQATRPPHTWQQLRSSGYSPRWAFWDWSEQRKVKWFVQLNLSQGMTLWRHTCTVAIQVLGVATVIPSTSHLARLFRQVSANLVRRCDDALLLFVLFFSSRCSFMLINTPTKLLRRAVVTKLVNCQLLHVLALWWHQLLHLLLQLPPQPRRSYGTMKEKLEGERHSNSNRMSMMMLNEEELV